MARQYQPPAPFVAPTTGPLDLRLAQVAQAINRKADATTQPVYGAVGLIAPSGAVYLLTVDDSGALSVDPVVPS